MTTTPKLGLVFLEEGQDQAEITHNDALIILDSIACLTVKDRDLSSPPGGSVLGDAYFVAGAGSGLWAGHGSDIAIFNGNNWVFVNLRTGWSIWVDDEATQFIWNGVILEDPLSSLSIPVVDSNFIGSRLVLGRINTSGGIVQGTGFSVTHVVFSARYPTTFAPPFPITSPIAYAGPDLDIAFTQGSCNCVPVSASQIDFSTNFYNFGGIDFSFQFIAFG